MRGLFAELTPHPPAGRSRPFPPSIHNPSAGEGPARAGWQKHRSPSTVSPRERGRLTLIGLTPWAIVFRSAIRTCLVVILLILTAERSLAARTEKWTEVRSPDFLVLTDANEKQGRHVALQFEMIRAVFRQFFNIAGAAKDPVVTIIAVKNGDGLKRLMPDFRSPKGWLMVESSLPVDVMMEEGRQGVPAGVYVAGPDKDHIALPLDKVSGHEEWDASGLHRAEDPFEDIHHEYVHSLAGRLPSQLPLWMVEGVAEFFGSLRLEGRQILFGVPSSTNLKVLLGTKLLPLANLFAVEASSPYYHEENRTSIFYAQSWLLTKYLVTRDWREGTHRVADFVGLLEQSVKPEEAARRTIGDPVLLQKELQRYLRFHLRPVAGPPMPPSLDANAFTAAPASPAESLAVRAEFMFAAEYAAAMAKTPDEQRDAAARPAMARQQQEHQKRMEESESEMSDQPDHPERPELEDSSELAEGIIEKAECNGSTTIDVTVKTSSGEIHLYSDRYMKLLYSALNFTLKENMNPCRDLEGWHARISYRPAKDPANPGEMMAVVLVKD